MTVGHESESRGHRPGDHPRHAQGRDPQPGDRLRGRPGVHPGLVRRRGGQARSVRPDHRGLDRQRADQRRGPLVGLRRQSVERAADHHQRVGRPPRQQGRRRRRDRHVRDLRRHPGDEEQPDRRDGPARLPRLEVEVQGRPARDLHPGLPGAAGQHDRDAALPRAAPRRPRARRPSSTISCGRSRCSAARCTRAATAPPSTSTATSRPSTAATIAASSSSAARGRSSSATCRCAAGSTASAAAPTSAASAWPARCPASPTSTCRSWRRTPRAGSPSNVARFTYGPVLRHVRNRSIKKVGDLEPEWRKRGKQLTSGYQKRW